MKKAGKWQCQWLGIPARRRNLPAGRRFHPGNEE